MGDHHIVGSVVNRTIGRILVRCSYCGPLTYVDTNAQLRTRGIAHRQAMERAAPPPETCPTCRRPL